MIQQTLSNNKINIIFSYQSKKDLEEQDLMIEGTNAQRDQLTYKTLASIEKLKRLSVVQPVFLEPETQKPEIIVQMMEKFNVDAEDMVIFVKDTKSGPLVDLAKEKNIMLHSIENIHKMYGHWSTDSAFDMT
jgi:hypothetical protein